ncbi:pectinesterase family protein [Telmatobacter bradus]|uniref:pectinesterase family protein n=1 Tax=Telmatobacter bradus TaxID=474953 RepID=UPI003B4356CA
MKFCTRAMARILYVVLCVLMLHAALILSAQTPVALPKTMTTLVGLQPVATTIGSACPTLSSATATTAVGDGCPAINATIGAAARGGVVVDPYGYVFIADDINKIVHMVDPNTGLMSVAAGSVTSSSSLCSGKKDLSGDGCLASTATYAYAYRGIGVDPYGNVLLAGYGDSMIHVICRAASPLCTASQIGYMEAVAGCSSATTAAGTSGAGTDGKAGLTLSAGTCSAALGEVYQPRGVTADIYGNVYFADTGSYRYRVILGPQTSNYFSGNNPLYTALAVHYASVTAGYAYTIAGVTTTATTLAATCSDANSGTSYSGTATDTYGDGCPFALTSVAQNTSYVTGVAADAAGNLIFADPSHGLRVFYVSDGTNFTSGTAGYIAGQYMKAAILANGNSYVTTPHVGYNYMLAGGGSYAPSSYPGIPILGAKAALTDTSASRLTVSPQGNIYLSGAGVVYFYDIASGYIRTILASGTNTAAGSSCGVGTSLSTESDGCPLSATAASSYGTFANSSGMGLAVDGQGNLYMFDTTTASYTYSSKSGTSMMVRKVLAQGFAAPSLGTKQTQSFVMHFPVGAAAAGTLTHSVNSDVSSWGTPSCTWYDTASVATGEDDSADCTVTLTATPSQAGMRSATMTVTNTGGESATVNVAGSVTGSVLAADGVSLGGTSATLTTASLLSGAAPAAIATDAEGNLYAASGSSILESLAASSSSTVTLTSSLSANPTQIAVDHSGDIYYLDGSSTIKELVVSAAGSPNSYSSTVKTISYTPSGLGTATPVALAIDPQGNLLVADNQSGTDTLYKISPTALVANSAATCAYPLSASTSTLPSLCQSTVQTVSSSALSMLTFGVVSGLTVSATGNIYVADKTNAKVYKLTPGVSSGLYAYTESTSASSVVATGLVTDAAGDLYVQSSSGVTMYPVSGLSSVAVYSTASSPTGVAVDGVGNVYDADSSNSYVTQIARGAQAENFGTSTTAQVIATLTNVGNQASAAQSGTDAVFVTSGYSSGTSECSFTSYMLQAMTAGESCQMSAYFTAEGDSTVSDAIAFTAVSPSTSTYGSLTLSGTEDIQTWSSAVILEATTTSSPTFASSGTEISYPITVATSTTGSLGSLINYGATTSQDVSVQIDSTSATATEYLLTSANQSCTDSGYTGTNSSDSSYPAYYCATLTLPLSGLTAGTHTLYVSFPAQGVFATSTTVSASFTLAQASTSLSWSPSATTQQVSAPLGTGVLDAVATPSVAGNMAYAYGAAPSCTSNATASGATPVDASTYLPIGSYTIYATFCPTDTTDYESISNSISYTVTQASTTAAIGASTMVLAPSGGNYSSLTTALQALSSTGGTIYIAPGIYSGQNVISYPNVALRGLGGDPTKVILTGENGDFSSTTYTLDSKFSLGIAGKGSDEGSATLDVSKNTYQGQTAVSATYTPNNFYAEYLTIQNTFNTDPNTTSTVTATSNGGTCSSGSTAHTYQYLYNNNLECGAQAMALFLNSDGAILNNVNLVSQQDTLYASGIGCGTYCTVAREYMWQGLVVGNVDYTFGDAALVFDHTNFFTTWHGLTATGQDTITAQNKRYATTLIGYSTGGADTSASSSTSTTSDYLSGFVCNSCKLLSQSTGMTDLYFGRPYLISSTYGSSYSTWIMLNNDVDQVAPKGWIGWDGASEYLSTSTYGEFNTAEYSDPTPGTSPYPYALFNYSTSEPSILYTSDESDLAGTSAYYYGNTTTGFNLAGGNTGSYGVNSSSSTVASRESYALSLNAGTAAPWYPVAFLATTVPSTKLSSGQSASWNPVSAMATQVNDFVPTSSVGSITNGSSVTILGRPTTPGAGVIPTGTYSFYDSIGTNQTCTAASTSCTLLQSGSLDASGEAYLTTSSLVSGKHYLTMVYGGDTNFTGSTSSVYTVEVLASGQTASTATLSVANTSSTSGNAITGSVTVAPTAATGTVTLYLDGTSSTTCTLSSGTCSWSISAPTVGSHTLYAYYPGTSSYGDATTSTTTIYVVAAVATGDTRSTTEPSIPSVCKQLNAALTTDVSTQDLDASVEATTTNIDGARIQAALNACSGTGEAVELSMDSTSTYNAFLSGPLTMPTNVTLLVDPGVTLYFSRNVQDYDYTSGTHTCGTINGNSATASCLPLIGIPKTSTNVGIMGYGKLNGRGNDTLLNSFTTSSTYPMPGSPTWWSVSAAANGVGNQQNPRFIQMNSGTSNVTLYKISLLNSPMFHVSTTGAVSGFTAWDIKIVTPTYARNTDGIDPGSVTNATITKSWISDGDDNIAVGASSTASKNISVTSNHFYAGHGASIGSYTNGGVSNILFDGNVSDGDGWATYGSAISAAATVNGTAYAANYADGNSTGIHIKSANDRGGLLTGIQYSNSCFYNHKTDIQITPYYSSGDSTSEFPDYSQILFQNLYFANDDSSNGTVELTGEYNTNSGSAISYPLGLTLDNVTFPSTLSTLVNSTTAVESSAASSAWGTNTSGGTGQYVNLTIGPGTVSSNFLTAYNTVAATTANEDTLTSNVSITTLDPPSCVRTYLAPELASPNGDDQTITYGNTATLYVIMTPTVGGAVYPTGTVTLTDEDTDATYTGTFAGTSDTLAITIPVTDLTVGTHTFEATGYTGDSIYTVPTAYQTFGDQTVTVNQASQTITFSPSTTTYTYSSARTFGVSATSTSGLAVSFASLTSSVCTVSSGTTVLANASTLQTNATVSVLTGGTCTIAATQTGNTNYAAATPVDVNFTIGTVTPTVGLALTTGSNPSIVDGSLSFTATVTSTVGSPTGKVTFMDGTTTLGSASLSSGAAVYTTTALPSGTDSITAVYSGDTNFGTVTSSALSQTVVAVTISTGGSSGSSSSGSSSSSSSSDSSSSTTATVAEGETASYTVSILPSAGTSFPAALTLTLSGLPTGATVTITPSSWTQTSSTVWTLGAGTTISANTQINIKLPSSSTAKSESKGVPFGKGGATALALLILLPFASRMRRTGKRLRNMVLSLLFLGALAAGMTACGAGGYYTGTPKSYTVVLTVASGSYAQSTNLTLNVE